MQRTVCLIVGMIWLSGCGADPLLSRPASVRKSSAQLQSTQAVTLGEVGSGLKESAELRAPDLRNWQVGPFGAEYFLERPEAGASPEGTLEPGTFVQVLERTDEYCRIVWLAPAATDRHSGWVAIAVLEVTPDEQLKVHRIPMH